MTKHLRLPRPRGVDQFGHRGLAVTAQELEQEPAVRFTDSIENKVGR